MVPSYSTTQSLLPSRMPFLNSFSHYLCHHFSFRIPVHAYSHHKQQHNHYQDCCLEIITETSAVAAPCACHSKHTYALLTCTCRRHTHVLTYMELVQRTHTHVHLNDFGEAMVTRIFTWTPSGESYHLLAAAPPLPAPQLFPLAMHHTPPLSAAPAPPALTRINTLCHCQQQPAQSAQHGPGGNDCPWRRQGRVRAAGYGSAQLARPAAELG